MHKAKMNDEIENTEKIRSTKDFEYSVQMTRWLLQILGMWPIESSYYTKLVRKMLIGFGYFFLMFLLIPYCLHMFLLVKDFRDRLRLLGPLSFCLMNIIKYSTVLAKEKDIRECFTWMIEDWESARGDKERNIMLENAKFSRFYTSICVVAMYGSGMPYSTVFIFTQGPIILGNITIRRLAYPSYYVFFDPNIRPIYDMIFISHCLCGFVMYTITCAVCSIAIVCIMHTCGQIGVTSSMLENLASNYDEKKLGRIIAKHWRTLQFASNMEYILCGMCLVELMGCTFNICMLGYYFITEFHENNVGSYMYCLILLSLTFNIFIFCYVGDLLTEQCSSIGEIAYAINWYQFTSKEARNIILIIVASSQHPVVLTAGKMTSLSMRCFSNVLKASVTYLNMLRTVTAKSI